MKTTFEEFIKKIPEAPANNMPDGPKEPAVAKEADPDDEDDDAEPAESGAKGKPRVDTAALIKALTAGDLDSIAEIADVDPALFDKSTRKWARNQRVRAELETKAATAIRERDEAKKSRETVDAVVGAIKGGAHDRVFELLQLLTAEDPDALLTRAVRARAIKDPRVPVLEASLKERDEKLSELEKDQLQRADTAYVEIIKDEVPAAHDVRKIPGWARKVAKTLKASLDPELGEPKLSVTQAANRVLRREKEKHERGLQIFGGAPERKTAPDPLARAGSTRGTTPGTLSREAFFARFK